MGASDRDSDGDVPFPWELCFCACPLHSFYCRKPRPLTVLIVSAPDCTPPPPPEAPRDHHGCQRAAVPPGANACHCNASVAGRGWTRRAPRSPHLHRSLAHSRARSRALLPGNGDPVPTMLVYVVSGGRRCISDDLVITVRLAAQLVQLLAPVLESVLVFSASPNERARVHSACGSASAPGAEHPRHQHGEPVCS